MIKTATQLKAKIRNLSGGDNEKSKVLIRNFVMERFLERVALSQYRNNFILKGGMLVAAVVGLENRATMDIDTTITSLSITIENLKRIIGDIIKINTGDGMSFSVTRVLNIMDEHDYPGIRFILEATLDRMHQTVKIDISTGDVITPSAVEYSYRLMFEERSILIWTYNLETILAEKMETIMARENTNTRMRDFYDIYILTKTKNVNFITLKNAFLATCEKRNTIDIIPRFDSIIESILLDQSMASMWNKYRNDNYFVENLTWEEVCENVKSLKDKVFW